MSLVYDGKLSVPEGVPELLRDLIHERVGTYFDASRLDTMIEKLEAPARARNCRSILDYYYCLKFDENGEWNRAMDALSVQETYFWREMSQIRALVDVLVPQWFERRSTPLRIWSAPCASGEEPFTIVMALLEAGWGNHPIQVIGSDASAAALTKARQAVYRESYFRALPPELRKKYFEGSGQNWKLSPQIVQRVHFQKANVLARSEISLLANSPIIFCRNLFIYFSPESI